MWNADDSLLQVSTEGNVTLTGHNSFTSPMYGSRVQLPEMYQTHNLSRLEALLSSPLPWAQYHDQLTLMEHTRQLADISLRGSLCFLELFIICGFVLNIFCKFNLKQQFGTLLVGISTENN